MMSTKAAAIDGSREPREHCNTFRAVGMRFPVAQWEFEAIASTTLLVVFSSVRKRHFFLLWKGGTCSFLVRTRKERKEAANVPFDRLCKSIAYLVGSRHVFALVNSCNPRRNTPNGRRVQSGSLAPAGASFPAAVASRTAKLPCNAVALHCDTIDFSTMLSKSIDRFPVYARRAHAGARFRLLGAVGMRFPVAQWEFEAVASTTLLVVFSSVRKRHFFFL